MLSVREISENIEQETLAPWATKSSQAVRDSEEAADDLRTAFQRDRDRIIHSTPFRKLKHKTQVYLCPGDHYRTRLTHSMEVSQIARTIARALRLNEDLTEADATVTVGSLPNVTPTVLYTLNTLKISPLAEFPVP